jgi:hypothetical protein
MGRHTKLKAGYVDLMHERYLRADEFLPPITVALQSKA